MGINRITIQQARLIIEQERNRKRNLTEISYDVNRAFDTLSKGESKIRRTEWANRNSDPRLKIPTQSPYQQQAF